MRQVRLAAFALAFFLLIPVAIGAVAIFLILCLALAGSVAYGLLSAGAWLLLDVEAARSATFAGLGIGAGLFVLLTLIWDRVFAFAAWAIRDKDAPFNG